ncbi:hypothetical protein D3C81_1676090 [compost metagenome]
MAERIWSARLKPSQISGTATSSIQPRVRMPAETFVRPRNRWVRPRISGQLAKASTAAQNSADQNGASTHRQAASSASMRICTNRRSCSIIGPSLA